MLVNPDIISGPTPICYITGKSVTTEVINPNMWNDISVLFDSRNDNHSDIGWFFILYISNNKEIDFDLFLLSLHSQPSTEYESVKSLKNPARLASELKMSLSEAKKTLDQNIKEGVGEVLTNVVIKKISRKDLITKETFNKRSKDILYYSEEYTHEFFLSKAKDEKEKIKRKFLFL